MKVQNVKGIYVYYVDTAYLDKKVAYYYFDNWDSFFNFFSHWKIISQFGNFEKIWHNVSDEDKEARYYSYTLRNHLVYYAAYDEEGNWFSPSHIGSFYGPWKKERAKRIGRNIHNRRHGRKRKAWGHYRKIGTFGSNRNDFYDPDAEEMDIAIKHRRKAVPPDSWDREAVSWMSKNWKCQSKRDHQWK